MTRVLQFPRGAASRSSKLHGGAHANAATPPTPEPGPDGLYRNTVIEAPYLDLSGRRLFVACGPQGQRLGEGVAVNEADIERVSARLWRAVDIESRGEGSILEPPQLM